MKAIVKEELEKYRNILGKSTEDQIKAFEELVIFTFVKYLKELCEDKGYQPIEDIREQIRESLGKEYDWYLEVIKYDVLVRDYMGKAFANDKVDRYTLSSFEEHVDKAKKKGEVNPMYEDGCNRLDNLLGFIRQKA